MTKEKQQKDDVKKLRQENDTLKEQLNEIQEELKNVKKKLETNPNTDELQTSVNFFSAEYDQYKAKESSMENQVKSIEDKLSTIEKKVYEIDEAIESILAYSYQYNIKIVGLPQAKASESAAETVELCQKLFNELSDKINVHPYDIDIAHRLPTRDDSKPATIVCKFTRRVAKEAVMSKRKLISSIDIQKLVPTCGKDFNSSSMAIFEHLTPKKQDLLKKAKSFQREFNYDFCWVKNGEVLLRESQDSKIIKIKSQIVLEALKTSISSPSSAGAWQFPPSFSDNRGRGRGRGIQRRSTRSTNSQFN